MRRLIFAALLSIMLGSTVGCVLPIYSGDPAIRTRQLIFTSENFRQIINQWERIWFLDQPDHMAPDRVHGGVI
jgi:hypothetical protein